MDSQGRVLATASDDKTVRLWNLPEGSPYAVLRVPIGSGVQGWVNAVALSPDGKTAAAAGETGEGEGNFSIYLFDVEKQALKGRIAGQPGPIRHLAYSQDGKRLAAAFGAGKGVRMWNVEGEAPKKAGSDPYQESCNWLDFDHEGRLATVSDDGWVRVYDPGFKLINQARPRPKAHPYSLAYSPAGRWLAVGYGDAAEVDILDGQDLKTAKTLSSKGLAGRNLAVVAWQKAASGEEVLLAGGDARNAEGKYLIRAWQDLIGADPKARDVAVADDIITAIAPLGHPQVDILYASADASWGGTKAGQVVYRNKAELWDARIAQAKGKSLRISDDGLRVEYPAGLNSDRRFVADLGKMRLEPREGSQDAGLAPPLIEWKPNKISGWPGEKPAFNGRPLALEAHERANVLAIDKLGRRFLLGTEYKLRLYDAKGKEAKTVDLPAPAHGVVVSGNGKLAVVALGDGTLRWYSLAEGELLQELANFFGYGQGKQWIAWTPEGFFGTSDGGGENLAGYHIDKGPAKRPEWVGFSQLYQAYYAPELLAPKLLREEAGLQKRLAALGTAEASLGRSPPPKVELVEFCPVQGESQTKGFKRADGGCTPILGPGQTRGFQRAKDAPGAPGYQNQPSAARVRLRYKVTVREGGLGAVDVYLNGKLQQSLPPPAAPPLEKAELNLEAELPLAEGDNLIQVKAYEKTGKTAAQSILADLFNNQAGAPKLAKQGPRLIVASVGIDHYGGANELRFAAKDAKDFLATVQRRKSGAYSEIKPFGVFDEQATAANIDKLFGDIQQAAGPDDAVLVYLSGHGYLEGQSYYFIPYGVGDNLETTALSQQRIAQNVAKLAGVRRVFLFIDSCHAGAFDPKDISSFDKLKQKLGVYVLAASQSTEEALDQIHLDGVPQENGLFALAVLEGLNGKAKREGAKIVNGLQLGMYVRERIDELSGQVHHQQKARFQQAVDYGDVDTFEITQVGN